MTRFVAANGKEFTDEDIERWAAEAEFEKATPVPILDPRVLADPSV